MATNIFATEASVFFVGGAGTQADSSAVCGGCTRDWYDNNFIALTDIMGANGAPLVAITSGEPEADGITLTKTGECGDVEAGMVAYLSGTNVTTGLYKVISATSNTIVFPAATFVIGGGWADDLVCNVGGAFDTLQNAKDNIDATSYNVHIYSNKSADALIDIDGNCGSIANKSQLFLIGFGTLPEDGVQVTHTNKGFVFGAVKNVFMENFTVANLDTAGFYNDNSSALGITLKNCHVNTNTDTGHIDSGFYFDAGTAIVCIDCTANNLGADGFHAHASNFGSALKLINCRAWNCAVGFDTGGYTAMSTLVGCIAYDNDLQGFATGSVDSVYCINCVSYNNGSQGFETESANGRGASVYIDCIAKDNTGTGFKSTAGAMPRLLNCCSHGNGTEFDATFSTDNKVLFDCIETDPLFVDAASDDFRLLPGSPCSHAGKDGLSIGKEQRKQYPMRIKLEGTI